MMEQGLQWGINIKPDHFEADTVYPTDLKAPLAMSTAYPKPSHMASSI